VAIWPVFEALERLIALLGHLGVSVGNEFVHGVDGDYRLAAGADALLEVGAGDGQKDLDGGHDALVVRSAGAGGVVAAVGRTCAEAATVLVLEHDAELLKAGDGLRAHGREPAVQFGLHILNDFLGRRIGLQHDDGISRCCGEVGSCHGIRTLLRGRTEA
jgi:hypothetical protein